MHATLFLKILSVSLQHKKAHFHEGIPDRDFFFLLV